VRRDLEGTISFPKKKIGEVMLGALEVPGRRCTISAVSDVYLMSRNAALIDAGVKSFLYAAGGKLLGHGGLDHCFVVHLGSTLFRGDLDIWGDWRRVHNIQDRRQGGSWRDPCCKRGEGAGLSIKSEGKGSVAAQV
jgi:hypothetical protein